MSALGRSGASGSGGHELTVGGVGGEQLSLETDAERGVGEFVDEDGAARVVRAGPRAAARELKRAAVEADGVVVLYLALVLTREQEAQIDAGQPDERALRERGGHREAPIEIGDEVLGEVAIGGGVGRNRGDAELLRQATLNRAERALTAAPRLRRAREDVADAEGGEGATHLAFGAGLRVGTGHASLRKVTPAIGVQLGEAAVVREDVLEGGKRR